jgi:hypothetical protein
MPLLFACNLRVGPSSGLREIVGSVAKILSNRACDLVPGARWLCPRSSNGRPCLTLDYFDNE